MHTCVSYYYTIINLSRSIFAVPPLAPLVLFSASYRALKFTPVYRHKCRHAGRHVHTRCANTATALYQPPTARSHACTSFDWAVCTPLIQRAMGPLIHRASESSIHRAMGALMHCATESLIHCAMGPSIHHHWTGCARRADLGANTEMAAEWG